MFKKIIIAALSASFIASAAFADSTNIGVRYSMANMAASGSETTDSAAISSGGAAVTQAEQNADFQLPSIFVEREIEINSGFSIAAGLDFVPLTAQVDSLTDGKGADAKIKAGNLFTYYLQPSFALNENLSLFGKIGYAEGDLEISDIGHQATAAEGLVGDTAATDSGTSKTLEGPMYGLGAQYNMDGGVFNFVRLEATLTDFDGVTHTNSNGKVLKADAEMELITLTVGKSF
jgi:hypothetical protein